MRNDIWNVRRLDPVNAFARAWTGTAPARRHGPSRRLPADARQGGQSPDGHTNRRPRNPIGTMTCDWLPAAFLTPALRLDDPARAGTPPDLSLGGCLHTSGRRQEKRLAPLQSRQGSRRHNPDTIARAIPRVEPGRKHPAIHARQPALDPNIQVPYRGRAKGVRRLFQCQRLQME